MVWEAFVSVSVGAFKGTSLHRFWSFVWSIYWDNEYLCTYEHQHMLVAAMAYSLVCSAIRTLLSTQPYTSAKMMIHFQQYAGLTHSVQVTYWHGKQYFKDPCHNQLVNSRNTFSYSLEDCPYKPWKRQSYHLKKDIDIHKRPAQQKSMPHWVSKKAMPGKSQ